MKEMKSNESSKCNECVFFDEKDNACIAFPMGIPDKYLNGESVHETPEKGQIVPAVFERKPIEY